MAILRRIRNPKQASGRPYRFLALEVLEDRLSPSANPFGAIATGLDKDLTGLGNSITGLLNEASALPFIGNTLSSFDANEVIAKIQGPLGAALQELGKDLNSPDDPTIRMDIVNAIATANSVAAGKGQPLLVLGNISQLSNIYIGHSGASTITIEMLLTDTTTQPTAFGTGLPGLPFQVTGNVTASLSFQYGLGFQYNGSTTSFVPSNQLLPAVNVPLTVTAAVSLDPGFNASGNIGFVHGMITSVRNESNGVSATFTMNNPDAPTTAPLTGSAHMNLLLSGGFSSDPAFPSIGAQFHLNWTFGSTPTVGFDNVGLNLGTFVTGVLAPILTDINKFTGPIAQILDVLTAPLPGISDISNFLGNGDVTLLTLANYTGVLPPGFEPLLNLVSKIGDLVAKASTFTDSGLLTLGGFNVPDNSSQNLVNPPNLPRDLMDPTDGDLTTLGLSTTTPDNYNSILQNDRNFKNLLGSVGATSAAGAATGFTFAFPFLDDPAQAVFKMLLGQDSDLVSLTANLQVSSDGGNAGLSFAGNGISIVGQAQINAHIRIAYDTFGLREAIRDAANHSSDATIVGDIADGIYVAAGDPSTGGSFFTIKGGIEAGLGFNFGIFSLSLNGGIGTNPTGDLNGPAVSFTLNEGQTAGKLRFGSAPGRFSLSTSIHTTGQLVAGLTFTASIGVHVPFVGFVGISHDFGLADAVLVDFDAPPPPPPRIAGSFTIQGGAIAAVNAMPDANGNLTLFIGGLSNLRQGVPNMDGGPGNPIDENYTISDDGPDTSNDGRETIDVSAYGITQTIPGVSTITAGGDPANQGTLTINVEPGVTANANLAGGGGMANLTYSGTGVGNLIAGTGDSTLVDGTQGTLYGGFGNNIYCGSGTVFFNGGNTTGLGHDKFMGHDTYIVQAPYSGSIRTDSGKSNTLELNVPQRGENIVVSPGEVSSKSSSNVSLADLSITGLYSNLIIGGGGGTNLTFNDLSRTGLQQVSVGVTPAPYFYSSGKKAAGGLLVASTTLQGSTVTVYGSSGTDTFDVSTLTDLETGQPLIDPVTGEAVTQVEAGPYVVAAGGPQDYTIRLVDLTGGDLLVLKGRGHGDHFHIAVDPDRTFGTSVEDSDSTSDQVTLDATNYPIGSLSVTNGGVTLAYTQVVHLPGGHVFDLPITDPALFFAAFNPHALIVSAAEGESFTADRSVGTTSLSEVTSLYDESGHDTFNVSGLTAYTLDGGPAYNDYTVNMAAYSTAVISDGAPTVSDTLVIDDRANSAVTSTAYTVTPGSVKRVDTNEFLGGALKFTLIASVTFTPMSAVTVDTNAGAGIADSIHIEATALGTTTTINEGTGLNYVYVSQVQQNLDLIAGPLTIAGSGDNHVLLYDLAPSSITQFRTTHQITVTPTTVTRTSVPVIPFLGGTSYSETINYSNVSELDIMAPQTVLVADITPDNDLAAIASLSRVPINPKYLIAGSVVYHYLLTATELPNINFVDNLASLSIVENRVLDRPRKFLTTLNVYNTPTCPTSITVDNGHVNVYGTTGTLDIEGAGVGTVGIVSLTNAVAGGGSLAGIGGVVTVGANPAALILKIDYSADTGMHHAVLAYNQLTGAAPVPISFGVGLQSLTIDTGGDKGSDITVADVDPSGISTVLQGGVNANAVYVQAASAEQGTLEVDAGAGHETVTLGATYQNLDYIASALTVNGGKGGTDLILDDRSGEGSADGSLTTVKTVTYTVTSQGITRSDRLDFSHYGNLYQSQTDVSFLYYGNLSSLTIHGGHSGNILNVQSTPTGTPVTINTGIPITADPLNRGNDSVNVGDVNNTLAGILGALTINGQGGPVPLTINDEGTSSVANYTLTFNALTRTGAATITYGSMSGLVINTAGSSTTDVQNTAFQTPVTINTGGGTSTVNVGTPSKILRDIGNLTVNGGTGGITTLNLDDQANADGSYVGGPAILLTSPTYLVTDHSVIRFDVETFIPPRQAPYTTIVTSTINFQNLAGLTLNGGTTPNVFDVQSTAAGTPVTINAGKSTDIVNVGSPSNTLDSLLGPLTVNGQKNTALNVNDQGTSTDETYSLTSTTLTRSAYPPSDAGAEMISYRAIASLVVHGGSGNNLFDVAATPAGTAVTLYGGTANSDQFMVGDNSDLDSILGSLTLHGRTAYSFAVFSDLVNAAVQTYTLLGNKLQRTGMADIAFDGLDQIALYGGMGKDTVNVESTLATTPVSIFTNGGIDTLNVSPVTKVTPVANDLGNIAGSLAFAALAGTDTLNLDDQATSTLAASYVITASSVSRPGMAAVTFTNIANVVINTRTGKLVG